MRVTWWTSAGSAFYAGKVVEYAAASEQHLVKYDDGDAKCGRVRPRH